MNAKDKNKRKKSQAAIVKPMASARSLRAQAAIGKPKVSTRRAQAAMEYLMTYGWAILVIVIVLALLAFFLPRLTKTPEVCQFSQPGFSCSEKSAIELSANQVIARFNLQNGKGQPVNVSMVLCTTASFADADKAFATAVPEDDQKIAAGSTKTLSAVCKDRNGNPLSLTANSDFKGTIVVYYNYNDDVTTNLRSADAVLTGTVLG